MKTKSFLVFAASVLIITGIAKLLDSLLTHEHLSEFNTLFPFLSNRQMLLIAGVAECGVAWYLVQSQNLRGKLLSVLWLCCIFAVYRVGLYFTHFTEPCSCFGLIGRFVDLGQHVSNVIAWILIGVLAVGSLIGLVANTPSR